jgi:hypothetical protein
MAVGRLGQRIVLDRPTVEYLQNLQKGVRLTGMFDEVYEDGTAKPPPEPEAVRSLSDPTRRQRAALVWQNVFRLDCLITQWYVWLSDSMTFESSDPTLALNLVNGVKDCVRVLCALGLFKEPEAQVIDAFPQPEQAPIEIRWYRWPENQSWMDASVERLRALTPLREQLRTCIRHLEKNPEPLLVEGLALLSTRASEQTPDSAGTSSEMRRNAPEARGDREPHERLPGSTEKNRTRRLPEKGVNDDTTLKLDDLATALLARWMEEGRPKISQRKVAEALDRHHSSLDDCPTFQRLFKAYKSELPRGYRNAKTKNIEAEDRD